MPQIGTTYRILYTAKRRVSGLTGIIARIVKPDNSVLGDLPLTEFSNILFKGMYFADVFTSTSDPVGAWIGIIYSPQESNYITDFSIDFTPATSSAIVSEIVAQVPVAIWTVDAGSSTPGTYGDQLNGIVLRTKAGQ